MRGEEGGREREREGEGEGRRGEKDYQRYYCQVGMIFMSELRTTKESHSRPPLKNFCTNLCFRMGSSFSPAP